jgi:hypothetical protein
MGKTLMTIIRTPQQSTAILVTAVLSFLNSGCMLPAPPVVLLPGLFAGAWIWKPAWDHLAALGYSVLQVVEPFAALHTKVGSIDRWERC